MADEAHEVTPREFLEKAIKSFEMSGIKTFQVGAVILLVDDELHVISAPLQSAEFLIWLESTMLKLKSEGFEKEKA